MKTLKLITAAVLMIALASCTKEYYTTEEYYEGYEENWFVDNFSIAANDWNLVGTDGVVDSYYYEYVFDQIPLNDSYYDGVVTAYIYLNHGTKDEVQTPLPYTEYKVYVKDNGEEAYYALHYSYDVKTDGTIAFKMHVSDYYMEDNHPGDTGTQYFRVAIVW